MENESHGPLLLIGDDRFAAASEIEDALVARATGELLLVLTAAAYERPERLRDNLIARFSRRGFTVRDSGIYSRQDAEDPARAAEVARAGALVLAGGSALHLRAVLKDSATLHALRSAWRSGALVAASGDAVMSLTDPMVDPRGGAFTVGLGLMRDFSVVPRFEGAVNPQLRRTLALAPSGCAVVALASNAAVACEVDGKWSRIGTAPIGVFLDGAEVGLEALVGKTVG